MSRYSPTVEPRAPDPLLAGLNALLEGGRRANAERREREFQEEEQEYVRGRRDVQGAVEAAELDRAGIRRGAAPTRRTEVRAPDVFGDALPGMAAGASGPSPLAAGLQGLALQGRPRPPRLVHRAGAYVPGLGFVPKNLTDQDLMGDARMGLAAPETREEADPRYRQLNEGFYVDEEATPEARQSRQEQERMQRLTQVLGALQAGGRDPELLAQALELDVPVSQVFQDEEEPAPTEEELRAARVPEHLIASALRDPTLARQLIGQHNRPEPTRRDPYGGRTREQYLADLEETERIRRRVAEEYDDRGGDPRLAERRKAIVEQIGAPINEHEQFAIDALAQGSDRETILLRMEELVELGEATEDELIALERYLDPFKLQR